MTDAELFEKIAIMWVDNGGDAEGLDYTQSNLKEAIQKEIDSREE
jgi:hypothetical protein